MTKNCTTSFTLTRLTSKARWVFSLSGNELPEKKASRILTYKTVDFDNKDTWSEQFDWMMDMAIKMKKAFKKYL